jgi:cytochrome o ubiquinol oxidase subunit 1
VGFYATFIPLYVAGLLGMTRRLQHYDVPEWRPWMLAATFGVMLLALGMLCQVTQLIVSIRRRAELSDESGDPWDGRSLEWATASPPPAFNFAILPEVDSLDWFWHEKQRRREAARPGPERAYEAIEVPRNSPTGFIVAFFATITGFALIWHIWWMVIAGLTFAYAVFVWFAWRDTAHYEIPAEEVQRIEDARRQRSHVNAPAPGGLSI